MTSKELDPYDIFSEMASNMFSKGGAPESLVEKGEAPTRVIGRSAARRGPRGVLYSGIDVTGVLSKPVATIRVSTDYAMTAEEAGVATGTLLEHAGLATETDEVKFYFVRAMSLCYALNSASMLMPGRAEFQVLGRSGTVKYNFFTDVVAVLGDSARRYFRAMADEVRTVLHSLNEQYARGAVGGDHDAYDVVVDTWNAVMRVASNRGLNRVYYLIHDSSDACSNLTSTERAYLAASKKTIFSGTTGNLVDNPVVARVVNSKPNRVGAVTGSQSGLGDDF